MTSKLILIAAAALITAPATAKAPADGPKAGKAAAAAEQKYCIEYEKMTGSRVSRQECRTKKEWAEEGVDVDELLKK